MWVQLLLPFFLSLQVDKELAKVTRKRGPYIKYTQEEKREIAAHAIEASTAKALNRYKSQYPTLSESTLRSFISQYKRGPAVKVSKRPSKLGPIVDKEIQTIIEKRREKGVPVCTGLVLAIAKGVMNARAPQLLKEHGGHIELSKG